MPDEADDIHPLFHGAPAGVAFRKLRKRLVARTREAMEPDGTLRPGDRWLVCLAGGKDGRDQSADRMRHQTAEILRWSDGFP